MKGIQNAIIKYALSAFILIFSLTVFSGEYFLIENNQKTDSLLVYAIDGVRYVDLNILSSALSLTTSFKKTQEEYRIESEKSYVILLINSPYYKSAGNVYKMSNAPVYHKELILFPLSSVKSVFDKILPDNAVYNDSKLVLTSLLKIKSIEEKSDEIKIVLSGKPSFTVETGERDILLFLKNTFVDENKFRIKNSKKLIRVLEPSCDKDESTIIITYAPEYEFSKAIASGDSIIISFFKRAKIDTLNNLSFLKTIIIDAGHGGKDPGAIGPSGLQEKTMNLDMASRLKKLINAGCKNLDVVMTRDKDEFVSLAQRTQLANKYPNSLFISIHCNASKNKSTKGFETYFLSTAKTDWERAVEARENSSLTFDLPEEERKGLDFILWDLAQNEFLTESSRLAEYIQNEYEKKYKADNRGLKQAGFYVLKGNYMPAVLVETAFISNKEEEKKLKSKDYRQELSQLIYNGLVKYIKEYEKKNTK
ncbi:MAG: N-acetylmuramoyl-L-alanine amidase [bacterium]|nr:N-acetylmuramoyl-L-alanine amidase [bacterium]